MSWMIKDLLRNSADQEPEKIAVRHKEEQWTYRQVYKKSLQLGNALLNAGIKRGDRVCFYMEKRLEKVIAIFGINIAGGAFVPIRSLAHANQVVHIINDSRARVLITTSSRVQRLLNYFAMMPTIKTIIVIDEKEFSLEHNGIVFVNWKNIMEEESGGNINLEMTERECAAILYTSGSTGRAKGVVLSNLNIVAGAEKVSEYLKIRSEDRLLCILSFGFDYGLNQLTSAFLKTAQIVLLDYLFPRDILKAVGKYKITGLAAVSTTWMHLLNTSWENSSMSKLRYITNSGGCIPGKHVTELKKRLPNTEIFLMYGLTEAFRSTYLDPSMVEKHPTSMGRAIPGEEIMVLDKDDHPVKPNEIGELVHRGVLVSQGYWGDSELTATRFRKNPFQDRNIPIPEMVVYSGDYVRIGDNGLLYFIGRKDEMIKCAGNRISPTEIEEVLYKKKGISDAVVFGLPNEIYGQSVFAVVSTNSEDNVDVHKLKEYCRETMPPYMIPMDIEIWQTLPLNENGKLDRSAVKKEVYSKRGIEIKFF